MSTREKIKILTDVRNKIQNGMIEVTDKLLSMLEAVGVNITGLKKDKPSQLRKEQKNWKPSDTENI